MSENTNPVSETTEQVPVKQKRKRIKYNITDEQFVEAWQSSDTAQEAADKVSKVLGYTIPKSNILAKASAYRTKGVNLKKMDKRSKSHKLDVGKLNQHIAENQPTEEQAFFWGLETIPFFTQEVNVRSDMPKVLCEEPRRGMRLKTRKGSRRLDRRTPMDEKPVKEQGNLRRQWKYNWNDGKEFGDHVQPLRRFILSCVGRKWDDVYSEIRKTSPKGTVVNNHLYIHLFQYVATNVRMIDDKPYGLQGYPVYEPTYVHPDTGVLCKTPERKSHRRKEKDKSNYIAIDENTAYYRKDGVWYICKFRSFAEKGDSYGYDVMQHECWHIRTYETKDIFGNPVRRNNCSAVIHRFINYYGRAVYCYHKRQISKKEIKKLRATLQEVRLLGGGAFGVLVVFVALCRF